MDIALQLFGYLILTVLTIVVPIFIVLLSIFQEGVSKLSKQYENQKSKSEENLIKQWKKHTQLEKSNKAKEMTEKMKKLKRSITEIETIKKIAETKLVYLNPKRQMAWLFFILMISFLGVVIVSLIKNHIYYTVLIILVSMIFFIVSLRILWKLLGIIVEVKKFIDEDKKEKETKTMDALLALQDKFIGEKKETPLFLKDVYLKIEGKSIKDEERKFEFPINSKSKIEISIFNSEEVMVKNLEVGLVFPSDFVIEKTNDYSIFTEKDGSQVIRFEINKIQAQTYMIIPTLIFTPITEGEHKIVTFIKAENIKPIARNFRFNIVEEIPKDADLGIAEVEDVKKREGG